MTHTNRRPVAKRKSSLNNYNRYALLFLAPFFLILLTFSIVPIIFTSVISFTKWDGFGQMEFVGWANYVRMFRPESRFFLTIGNTFLILAIFLPLNIICGLLAAHMMNSRNLLGKKFFQLSNFLPYIATPVAIGLMWSLLFDWKFGAVNSMIAMLGYTGTPINWLGSPAFARIVLALILVWKNFGYVSVMFLAGISAISYDIYEAASLEGASSWQIFLKITIPLLKPIITFITVTGIIGGLQLFDEPYLLFQGGFSGKQPFGGPELACLTMVMNFYDTAFKTFDLGFGAALAYGMFVVILSFSLIMLRLMTRAED